MLRYFSILLFAALALLACAGGTPDGRVQAAPVASAPPALVEAFQATERARALLSDDQTEGLAPVGEAVAAALERARPDLAAPLAARAEVGASAAHALASAADIAAARTAFSELNAALFDLAATLPALQQGWNPVRCPMAPGFQKWFQTPKGVLNPYFGKSMLTCGEVTDWGEPIAAGAGAGDDDAIAFWTCPMHPGIRQPDAGSCPICGMDLVSVTVAEARDGVVRIDELRRSQYGIRTEVLTEGSLTTTLRATGRVLPAEGGVRDVTLLVGGQVRQLRIDRVGHHVRRGEVLLTLYSPELVAAEGDLVALAGAGEPLREAVRQRLRRWGLTDAQIAQVESQGAPIEELPVLAPTEGVVLEKGVLPGATLSAGQLVVRIAPLDPIWVEAELYEGDLDWVTEGMVATISLPQDPTRTWEASVDMLVPSVDPATRTRTARLVVPNADGALLPGMYADVSLRAEAGPVLRLPDEAVVYTGPRRVAYLDMGDSRLRPREVQLGRHGEEGWQVVQGLEAGDRVVISGDFLVAAESRIRRTSGGSESHSHEQP